MRLNYEAEFPKLITRGKMTKLLGIVDEFEKSDHPVAEVEFDHEDSYSSPINAANALHKAVTRSGKRGIIRVVRRKDQIFLVKEEV